ncbi:MAG: hypothetical protein J6S75_08885, partial [Thermoguttaceae bacterium]|nr:hypothetical protein [Thermoguttaceae bacterium]
MRVKNVFSVVGSVLLMISPAAMAEEDSIVVAEEAAVPSPPAAAQAETAQAATQAETAQAASPYSTNWVQQMAPVRPCNSGFKFSGCLNAGGLFNDHGAE